MRQVKPKHQTQPPAPIWCDTLVMFSVWQLGQKVCTGKFTVLGKPPPLIITWRQDSTNGHVQTTVRGCWISRSLQLSGSFGGSLLREMAQPQTPQTPPPGAVRWAGHRPARAAASPAAALPLGRRDLAPGRTPPRWAAPSLRGSKPRRSTFGSLANSPR